jgi:hypothetical protein
MLFLEFFVVILRCFFKDIRKTKQKKTDEQD